jgi:hypothetical protein
LSQEEKGIPCGVPFFYDADVEEVAATAPTPDKTLQLARHRNYIPFDFC